MSTAQDKLSEFQRAWMDADANYQKDLDATAGNGALAHDVETNWWIHQANWARAATAALDANSTAIDAAFQKAKTANDSVVAARKKAEGLIDAINGSSEAARALTSLLKALAV